MNDRNDPLVRQAATLPDEIAPERDLWPAIAERLNDRAPATPVQTRPNWPFALAAGIALVALSSLLTWSFTQRDTLSTAELVEVITAQADPFVNDVELIQARQALTVSLDDALGRLAPPTRRKVADNLLEIHQSMAEIRVALEEDPDNALLHQLLHTVYQQEIGLLTDINKLAATLPEEIEI